MPELTGEQQTIIDAIDDFVNCVVIACPGSGKTFTLAYAIRRILPELLYYQGVIAISFTNKASDELKTRSLLGGVDRKSSFFGTIDKFYLTEIIIPFGRHIWGEPQNEIEVVTLDGIADRAKIEPLIEQAYQGEVSGELVEAMGAYYADGKILLEAIGCLAVFIFEQSLSCRRYISARYSRVFIDEYQDCDCWQHSLYVKLVELGLQGIAVGDINQSIFAFANKDSKYLVELTQNTESFKTYTLTRNHRSHISIVNYSMKLMSSTLAPQETEQIRVYEKRIVGSEIKIAHWLNSAVPHFSERIGIDRNGIGVLFKNRRTGTLIHRNISFPHKSVITTPLDNDSSLWGAVFRKILNWAFSEEVTKYELVEEYLNIDIEIPTVRAVMRRLQMLEEVAQSDLTDLVSHTELFSEIADLIFPQAHNNAAVSCLESVLTDRVFLDSFIPPSKEQVVLMTLHKSKGLQFKVVFHLDLHRWILPMYKGDYVQDLNLHYVGITRAIEHCILCTSTTRHNSKGRLRDAEPSGFLNMNQLDTLRVECPV